MAEGRAQRRTARQRPRPRAHLHTHLLLELERVGVEMLLQLLVRVVDAELLERVALKDFETCDNTDQTNSQFGLRDACADLRQTFLFHSHRTRGVKIIKRAGGKTRLIV